MALKPGKPAPRLSAMATGEQVSVGLLAIALLAEGIDAISFAGWQVFGQRQQAVGFAAHG